MDALNYSSLIPARFKIEDTFGEGRWGVVLKAWDEQLKRTVAIKYLKPNLIARDRKLERFLDEARIIAKLYHPNVVTIFDLLTGDEGISEFAIVMEYAKEGTLRDLLEKQPGGLPVLDVLRLGADICAGLDAVHRKGVIHRDLKPTNVLLFRSDDGELVPKIADFGIARSYDEDDPSQESSTGDQRIIGTPDYMSPEQANGGKAQPVSDIYAVGVMLYELLTGTLPFKGGAIDTIVKGTRLMPPIALRPDVSTSLDLIVVRCLELEQDKRFSSARALRDALLAIYSQEEQSLKQIEIGRLREEAQVRIARGNLPSAIAALEQLLEITPDDAVIRAQVQSLKQRDTLRRTYDEAEYRLHERDLRHAITQFAHIVARDVNYRDALQLLIQAQRREAAEKAYAEGMRQYHKHNWPRAIENFRQALNKQSEHAEAHARLEEALMNLRLAQLYDESEGHALIQQWDQAIQKLEEILKINPKQGDVRSRIELMQFQRRLAAQYKEAEKALARNDWRDAKQMLARIAETKHDYFDVQDKLKLVSDWVATDDLYNQGVLHENAHDYDRAIEYYSQVLENDAEHIDAAQRLADLQTQRRIPVYVQNETARVLQPTTEENAVEPHASANDVAEMKGVEQIDTPAQSLPMTTNGAMRDATAPTPTSMQRVAPKTIVIALVVIGMLVVAAVVLIPLLRPAPAQLSTQAQCLQSAEATLLVIGGGELSVRVKPGEAVDLDSERAELEVLLESTGCTNLREALTYDWEVVEGTVTKAFSFPWIATYTFPPNVQSDTINITVKTRSDNYPRNFSFFINHSQ